ncbi:hypothetical protein IWZ03DRAFT_27357 [Phyllosticta citriasiana]|uniref:Uncharacterized protein n=1 Tax=Phyllosticta citriasiana TaxID=595635 RepID=A0ABR1L0E7_9PEZI
MASDQTNPFLDPPANENGEVSTPATASDSDPLQMTPDREDHALTKSTSDTQTRSSIPDEEDLDVPMRWPIRHNSASSDPVTRERRVKRLSHLIERAKHRAAPQREPLQTPAETVRVHRVHAMANPGKRRTAATVTPKLLWLTKPLGHHQAGAERLLRRAGRHMKPKSGSHAEGTLPMLTPSEESDRSRVSAPEYAVLSRRASSGALSGRSNAKIDARYQCHHKRQPSLQLLSDHRNRADSLLVNPSSSPRGSLTPSTDSGSHGSRRSVKSTCADVATTKADVQAVTVSPARGSDDSSSCGTQTSVKHVVESGHGAYEIVWDDRSSSPALDAYEPSSRPRSNSDPCVSRPSLSASRRNSFHSSPPGLMRVNTKLEEWCFAAREATALDRTRSHPHFRSYVEVYQEPELPTFEIDKESSENLTMAPPNSTLHSALASHRASMDTTPKSLLGSASPGPQHFSASEPAENDNQSVEYTPYSPLVDMYEPELIIPSGYYSPRPNRRVKSSDRLKPQSRSFSGLSSLSADTHDLLSIPQTFSSNPYCDTLTVGTTHQQRQIFRLQQERYPFLPNPPLGGDLLNAAHRDSIVLAKDRIRRKHAAAAGPAGDLQIPTQPGSTAPALTTGPIAIPVPRAPPQLMFVGALSPIPDGSPPNWVKGIEERAKEQEERKKKAVEAEAEGQAHDDEGEVEKKGDDGHSNVDEKSAVDAAEGES